MSFILASDLVRILVFVLFGLSVGYTLWIIRLYYQSIGRLLPRHILSVGIVYILALVESAWRSAIRVGEPADFWMLYHLVVMSGSYYALRLMTQHLKKRYSTTKKET